MYVLSPPFRKICNFKLKPPSASLRTALWSDPGAETNPASAEAAWASAVSAVLGRSSHASDHTGSVHTVHAF